MKRSLWLWLLAILAALTLLATAAPTRAQTDHYQVVGEELDHLRKQAFAPNDYGIVVMDSTWEGATAFFGRDVDTVMVIIPDDRWTGHTRAITAHELGHVLAERKGLAFDDVEAEEQFAQNFAACFGSYPARVWLRIRERVRPSAAECETIRLQLGGKPPAQKATVPDAVMRTGSAY